MKDVILEEKEIAGKLIQVYCRAKHGTNQNLCSECEELFQYAQSRIEHCFFGENKPVCGSCPIHCYKKERREQITKVMRYAGPRMIYKHPLIAIKHMMHSLKPVPKLQKHKKI